MAFDWSRSGIFSGRTNHDLYLYVRRNTTDAANNRSNYGWELRARRISGSVPSWALDQFPWRVQIGGYVATGTHNLDFRSTATIIIASGVSSFFPHAADGTLNIYPSASMGPASIFGSASLSGTFATDRIARVPSAPTAEKIDQVTPTSLRFWFHSNGDGGSPLLPSQMIYSTTSNFTPGTYTIVSSNGITTVTGLTPGTKYYVAGRCVNAVGAGPWSATLSATTLPSSAPTVSVTPALTGTSATLTMIAPGGITGVTRYNIERRLSGTTTPTALTSTTNKLTVTGLTPGKIYEWRASATIGAYTTPLSGWLPVAQPNPNTSPGDYFDGSTAASGDMTFAWTGTVGGSTSNAIGRVVVGWAATFAFGLSGAVHQVTGGYSGGNAARVLFNADATAQESGRLGMSTAAPYRAAVEPNTFYVGSIYVKPSRDQVMRAFGSVYNAAGALLGTRTGPTIFCPGGDWTRLTVDVITEPTAASMTVSGGDAPTVVGATPWKSGEWLMADAAMVTLSTLFPYFDGSTADTPGFRYDWLGATHSSVSTRTTLVAPTFDLLADPDCPPLPAPPMPPTILSDCIDEVGVWRRYTLQVPESEVGAWSSTLPTLHLQTGGEAERQVRIRYYANGFGESPEVADLSGWEAELILTYIPPNTVITLDGVAERVWAEVAGGERRAADILLYGTGGSPATWPELRCGTGYIVTLDTPLDAPAGNLNAAVLLTQRM